MKVSIYYRACNEPETYSLSKLQKFRRFVRLEKTTIPSEELNLSAMRLFVCCSEYGDFPLFIERFGLEDTLSCWVHLMQVCVFQTENYLCQDLHNYPHQPNTKPGSKIAHVFTAFKSLKSYY